ncbi:hypothetical protein Hanom_Chr17g01565581 [Helianthus anomalus]
MFDETPHREHVVLTLNYYNWEKVLPVLYQGGTLLQRQFSKHLTLGINRICSSFGSKIMIMVSF